MTCTFRNLRLPLPITPTFRKNAYKGTPVGIPELSLGRRAETDSAAHQCAW